MSVAQVNEFLLDKIKKLALSPYRFVYFRNTHDPIVTILNTTDGVNCLIKLKLFFKLKLREVQYVQIAVSSILTNFDYFSFLFFFIPTQSLLPSVSLTSKIAI